LKWQKQDFTADGNDNLNTLLANLSAAEEEDVEEETDTRWFRPQVKKKSKVSDSVWRNTDEFHDPGKDFATVGLRGTSPKTFGWGDWGAPPEGERDRFYYRQKALSDHYAWFRKHRSGAWLRS